MAAEGSFTANGKTYSVPTDLTIGEMLDAEQAFDIKFGEDGASSMRMGAALVWLALRRDDPSVEPEAIRGLPMSLFADMAADASPPVPEPDVRNGTSGEPSGPSMGIPDDPRDSGSPGSDIGSVSARETFFASLQPS